jgi:hypothetical protein
MSSGARYAGEERAGELRGRGAAAALALRSIAPPGLRRFRRKRLTADSEIQSKWRAVPYSASAGGYKSWSILRARNHRAYMYSASFAATRLNDFSPATVMKLCSVAAPSQSCWFY